MNVDADVVNADWLRVAARMRVIAAEHPELTQTEVWLVAERAYLASVVRSNA